MYIILRNEITVKTDSETMELKSISETIILDTLIVKLMTGSDHLEVKRGTISCLRMSGTFISLSFHVEPL